MPYDTVRHAGGKTFNYYVSSISQHIENQVKVIGLCKAEELKEIKPKGNKIELIPVVTKGGLLRNLERVTCDVLGSLLNLEKCDTSYYKYLRITQRLKDIDFEPDVVILEWTNMVLLWETVRKRFPYAKIVASEHDVTYQGLQRKKIPAQKLATEKLREITALQNCNLILVQSDKDKQLLLRDGVKTPIFTITPYYHNMGQIKRKNRNHDILFWGAMYRSENYEAAIWFIEMVMPLLSDIPVRFVVVGNRPPEQLKKYADERIVVTGFVEDETPLFESSMCFVSPLLTGAGIKVKVVEALSAGIPILTNSVGIEGIPAQNGESYFHCETPKEYATIIRSLYNGEVNLDGLEEKQRTVISQFFDLEKSCNEYVKILQDIFKCKES